MSFNTDVAKAAQELVGAPAVNHKRQAGCDFGESLPECMEVGLNAEGFDCSGLVIASICKVIDRPIVDWPRDLRHVRQIHNSSDPAQQIVEGSLLIFGRRYKIDGRQSKVAAHIGIVLDAQRYSYIHAVDSIGLVTVGKFRPERILKVVEPQTLVSWHS